MLFGGVSFLSPVNVLLDKFSQQDVKDPLQIMGWKYKDSSGLLCCDPVFRKKLFPNQNQHFKIQKQGKFILASHIQNCS